MQPEARHRPLRLLRYILIAVAISASLFLAWLALNLFLSVLNTPYAGNASQPAVCVVAALVMAGAAGGLIAGRAWGAYLLSVVAFVVVGPLAFLALWLAIPWDGSGPHLWVFLPVGAVLLIGVLGVKLGRSMRREERGG